MFRVYSGVEVESPARAWQSAAEGRRLSSSGRSMTVMGGVTTYRFGGSWVAGARITYGARATITEGTLHAALLVYRIMTSRS